ncbi:MAG TPA: hypothetical protein VK039_08780, partial [Brevibacterium sp.]|nr:hypothetical protein [Brevibacterium sp.]
EPAGNQAPRDHSPRDHLATTGTDLSGMLALGALGALLCGAGAIIRSRATGPREAAGAPSRS